MQTVNMEQAKSMLPELVQTAALGEPFLIEQQGKPTLKVTIELAAPARGKREIGFMEGQFTTPDDFDTMGQQEIEEMFGIAD